MLESPCKVSLERALASEASVREDAVIGLNWRAGVVRFTSEGDCGLFASHVKNLTNSVLRGSHYCVLRSTSKIAPGGH